MKSADPQQVKRADPRRVNERTYSWYERAVPTEGKNSYFIVCDEGGQNMTYL